MFKLHTRLVCDICAMNNFITKVIILLLQRMPNLMVEVRRGDLAQFAVMMRRDQSLNTICNTTIGVGTG